MTCGIIMQIPEPLICVQCILKKGRTLHFCSSDIGEQGDIKMDSLITGLIFGTVSRSSYDIYERRLQNKIENLTARSFVCVHFFTYSNNTEQALSLHQ